MPRKWRTPNRCAYPSIGDTASASVGRELSQTGAMITRRNLNVQPIPDTILSGSPARRNRTKLPNVLQFGKQWQSARRLTASF